MTARAEAEDLKDTRPLVRFVNSAGWQTWLRVDVPNPWEMVLADPPRVSVRFGEEEPERATPYVRRVFYRDTLRLAHWPDEVVYFEEANPPFGFLEQVDALPSIHRERAYQDVFTNSCRSPSKQGAGTRSSRSSSRTTRS